MKNFAPVFFAAALAGCNSVNIKPGTLDKSETIFADRGGYSMKHALKQELEERGHKVIVGKFVDGASNEEFSWEKSDPMGARYVVRVQERAPRFSPLICLFNGWRWWVFNVSIADQKTGEELLAWTGRGCASANVRRLRRLMDEVEKK